ncbi:MAG TPA: zf-TFIIB domain-containing protein, partial [Gemmatimonadales bacterium]|nr:zf-TFIIB domain-containing protein [Gemmatimonadales bacterium]
PLCGGLWFDATELDGYLRELPNASPHEITEAEIPRRGASGRSCPRCGLGQALESAGWSTLILDRCPACHGLFVDAEELRTLETADVEGLGGGIEQALISFCQEAGYDLLVCGAVAELIAQVVAAVAK